MKRYFFGATLLCFLYLQGSLNNATRATEKVCNVINFGAKANGIDKDTKAIQSAINNCAQAGGGIVQVPSGKYLIDPIFLKSRVTLFIDKGAVLLASQNPLAYKATTSSTSNSLALVNAVNQSDIAIAGQGTIDGAGAAWWNAVRVAKKTQKSEIVRPRLVVFSHCQRVLVAGITLMNSPSFHLVPMYSDYVTVKDVTIKAPPNSPNTDGIDPSSSHHVWISHCMIDNGDDNIAIKSGHIDPAYPHAGSADITISNCTFLHGHGVSIGSETSRGVRNVIVENCNFIGTKNGLRIKSLRGKGGIVENIIYRNIQMQDVSQDITFTSYYPKIPQQDKRQPITGNTPSFHDISINNLVAKGGKNAGIIVGLPEKPLFNIALNNINIVAQTGIFVRNATIKTSNVQIYSQQGRAFILENQGHILAR
ncbi:glycoside hydrolase family 28 protein [Nostoc linckia FACHB-104]|nr:glycoside hydrolase family 28 protein [Nostoc linckia FACHB-104]